MFVDTQFSSVKRQLNLYGFRLIQRGENKGFFFQQSFRRDDIITAQNLVRVVTPKKKRACSGVNLSTAKLAKLNRSSKLCATSDAMLNEILHGTSIKLCKSDSEEESDDETEMTHSQPYSHQLGFDLKGVSDGKPTTVKLEQEITSPYENNTLPIPIQVRYPQAIRSIPPPKIEPLRPSALSSRLGFNMDLLNRFQPTSKFAPQQSIVYQQHYPQATNRFQTYSDIDLLDSELYRIGPPPSSVSLPLNTSVSTTNEDEPMSMCVEECQQLSPKMIFCPSGGGDDTGREISVEDMLAFLDQI